MITRTSSMDASWRVGVWPRSLFTTLSARIPHLHPKKAPQGNRNLSDIEPLSPIPLRPLHSNSLAQYISLSVWVCIIYVCIYYYIHIYVHVLEVFCGNKNRIVDFPTAFCNCSLNRVSRESTELSLLKPNNSRVFNSLLSLVFIQTEWENLEQIMETAGPTIMTHDSLVNQLHATSFWKLQEANRLIDHVSHDTSQ